MFSKSNLLATLASGIFLFFGGYLVWMVLTADYFAAHAGSATGVWKDPSDMLYIVLGCLIQAFFLSAIYSKWASGVHSVKSGFEFGALVGAFTGFGMGLLWYATSNLSADIISVLVEGVIEVIFYGITGAIIALVYKATSK